MSVEHATYPPCSPAARRMYRDGKDKRRKTRSSRSLRAALLPAERTPRRPLKVSESHSLLFQSVSGALRVLTRERASESQRAPDGGTPTTCGGRATTGGRDSPRRKCNPGPRTAPRCQWPVCCPLRLPLVGLPCTSRWGGRCRNAERPPSLISSPSAPSSPGSPLETTPPTGQQQPNTHR